MIMMGFLALFLLACDLPICITANVQTLEESYFPHYGTW